MANKQMGMEISRNSRCGRSLRRYFTSLILGSAFVSATAIVQAATVEGVVRGPDRKPMKGADVRLEAKMAKVAPLTVQTDAAGKYRFSDVADGVYKVTVLSGSAVQGFIDNVRAGSSSRRVDFDIRPASAGKAKNAKHLVWVPETTGSHLGGHWAEVTDEGGTDAGSQRVEKKSGQALRSLQNQPGNSNQPGGH